MIRLYASQSDYDPMRRFVSKFSGLFQSIQIVVGVKSAEVKLQSSLCYEAICDMTVLCQNIVCC